jgi:hypothetical protein
MKREIALEEHMSLSKEPAFPLSLLSIVHRAVLCCRPLAATLSMRRVVPVRIMLIPTNVPITTVNSTAIAAKPSDRESK